MVAVLSHKLWGGLLCSPIGKVIPNVCDQPLGEASQLLCSEYVFIRKASPYDLALTKGGSAGRKHTTMPHSVPAITNQ